MSKQKKSEEITLTSQLREMIEQSGMTTNALAVAAGIPQPVLHRFRNGDQANIRLDTAARLCQFFGVKLTAPKVRKPVEKKAP